MSEKLAGMLNRCRTVLANMALENEGAGLFQRRWPIHHEPLRADAKNLVHEINRVMQAYHSDTLTEIRRRNDDGIAAIKARAIAHDLIKSGIINEGAFTATFAAVRDRLQADD